MTSSTPSSLRYRPVVLVCTGLAAAYTAYLVYSAVQASPGDGLHRSNALRRQTRRRGSTTANSAPVTAPSSDPDEELLAALGEYNVYGTSVPLNPRNLIRVNELRQIITQARPDLSQQELEATTDDFYTVFLDRLIGFLFRERSISVHEINAIRDWVGVHIPDPMAVDSAIQRHNHNFAQANSTALGGTNSVAGTELSWGDSDDDSVYETLDEDGQTLQRTLYHIAEDRARQEGIVHRGITCNGCDEKPIRGVRWHCANCVDFDLCSNCEATNSHIKTHIFYKVRVPAPHLSLQKQEPVYPGMPHLMDHFIDPGLRKRLVSETKMETEEMEALWDQFTCLASTKWDEDPSNVGFALDRRAFNHAFVPRYNSFVAAPNLVYDRIFAYYDTDKNGLIGFDEWIKGIAGMHTTDVEVKARIVFDGYDIDGDGYISRRDLLRIFRAYYAIEKEATQNYVAELTDEYSPRNQLEKILSSQPLGAAFTPNNMASTDIDDSHLRGKCQDDDNNSAPVLNTSNSDFATRQTVLRDVIAGNDRRTEDEPDRLLAERWKRRQFYVDEEEGMTQPNDQPAEHDETSGGAAEHIERPETLTSEQWGDYDIPKPEVDLGSEVLYQLTQQGFNELLDPLFKAKEDVAMAVAATASLRLQNAPTIQSILELFPRHKAETELIAQIGFFRYAKGIIAIFYNQLNHSCQQGLIQDAIRVENSQYFDPESAKKILYRLYVSNDEFMQRALKKQIVKDAKFKEPDDMATWDLILCLMQLREEILHAAFDCLSRLGWFETRFAEEASSTDDPTLPQFRPNSSTQRYNTSESAGSSSDKHCYSHRIQQPSVYGSRAPVPDYHFPTRWRTQEGRCMESAPTGPFFVFTDSIAHTLLEEDSLPENIVSQPPCFRSSPSNAPYGSEGTSNPTPDVTPTDARFQGPGHKLAELSVIDVYDYTNSPEMNILYITSPTPGTPCLSPPTFHAVTIPAVHGKFSQTDPSLNQIPSLVQRIRQRAMDPNSRLHVPMLASLELAEQEMRKCKGGGLIGFEEFAEHIRQGKLKFLESWMEWSEWIFNVT